MSIYARVCIEDQNIIERFPRIAEVNGQIVALTYGEVSPHDTSAWFEPLRGPQDEGVSFKLPLDCLKIYDDYEDELPENERIQALQDVYIGELLMRTFWKRDKYTEVIHELERLDKLPDPHGD